ncbi:MAG TPA: CapA family protein, partial [Candidatus Dormibacteraeota bacterium]|nr:CapA family protein [Candidatus Dormibacteraeota bacterium]
PVGGSRPPSATASPGSGASGAALPGQATTTPQAAPSFVAEASASVDVALVAVVGPGSTRRTITLAGLTDELASPASHVAVSVPDLPALSTRLGVTPDPAVRQLPSDQVMAAVIAGPALLGIVRAVDVTPAVRALAIDGRSLFGAERVRSLDGWPLTVAEGASTATAASVFDPTAAWTLVAGGDVMLDRAVYRQTILLGKGADYPWDGGTAEVVGRECCGAAGALLPDGARTGDAGAVRALMESADLAVVNLEGPSPDAFTYHPGGLVFTFDPALLAGLRDAGIDAVSLANNHISNAGGSGVAETIAHLDAAGLAHSGAGPDLEAARRPAILEAGRMKVAVLAYDGTRPDLDATASHAGAAPLRLDLAAADIRSARAAGADVVVVMIHWGVEYSDAVTSAQRALAADLVAAGADAIVGSHPHWLGPIETIDGRPVLYSLGDLVFQLTHDRRTMESALADLTFVGRRLVQLDLHPTLILDGAQPNLLDPTTGDGAAVLDDVRRASAALPPR